MSYYNFLQKLKYKAKMVGIEVEEQEESYTSITSYLDLETPCEHQTYKGNRLHRGLFESSQGIYINADVNGAYQILRKKHAPYVNINICNIESKRVNIR